MAAFCLAAIALAKIETEDGVLVVNKDNFDSVIQDNDYVLLEFCKYRTLRSRNWHAVALPELHPRAHTFTPADDEDRAKDEPTSGLRLLRPSFSLAGSARREVPLHVITRASSRRRTVTGDRSGRVSRFFGNRPASCEKKLDGSCFFTILLFYVSLSFSNACVGKKSVKMPREDPYLDVLFFLKHSLQDTRLLVDIYLSIFVSSFGASSLSSNSP